jgi:hypothetical protein
MKPRALFAMIALLPAALGTAPAAARGIAVPLCRGSGAVHLVVLPTGGAPAVPSQELQGCCAKGCHTGSRKKILKDFEPEQ